MLYTKSYTLTGCCINPHYEIKDFYIVNFIFESIACYCAEKKVASFDLQKDHKSWVLTDAYVELYQEPLLWHDEIEVRVGFRPSKGIKLWCDAYIYHHNKEIGKATTQWVIIDEISRRPSSHPLIKTNIEVHENLAFEGFRFPPISIVDEKVEFQQKIGPSLLDFNHHLNSYHYFRFAYDALDPDFTKNHYPSVFQAKFEKEVKLNELLIAFAQTNIKQSTIQLKRKEASYEISTFKLRVEWKEREA